MKDQAAGPSPDGGANGHTAPQPRQEPRATTQHGLTRQDEYAWMRADNWRAAVADPAALPAPIRAHVEAENAYCAAWMARCAPLQRAVLAEMRGRIKDDEASPPQRDGPFMYGARFEAGAAYPVFERWAFASKTGPKTVLFDAAREAEASPTGYFDLGGLSHSPDHRFLAIAVDTNGDEAYTISVRDLQTGQSLAWSMPHTAGDMVWANDSRTLLWVDRDADGRPWRVRRGRIDADPRDAKVVYTEADPGFFVSLGKTESDRFLVIDVRDHATSEQHLIPAGAPATPPRCVATRHTGVEYDVTDCADRLFILTNAGGAIDFQIMTAPLDAPGRAAWTPWIAAETGVMRLAQYLFARHHVRLERVEACARLVIHRLSDGQEHTFALPEAAYGLDVVAGFAFDTDTLRMAVASPTRPDEVRDYDMEARSHTVVHTRTVPSGFDPARYAVHQLTAQSRDGAQVPVTLLARADALSRPGPKQALVEVYGAYGAFEPATFQTGILSLVDRGVVVATAHVRGGSAKGNQWYLDAKKAHKSRSIDDYLAACDAVVAAGFADPGRLIAAGESAGGLVVGAALNRAPERFAGAVLGAPFVDVLNTMCDPSLPLTIPERGEWGDPLADPDAYAAIAAYCPYQNVARAAYPPVLTLTALSDTRVTYWEPLKWIARLRARASTRAAHGEAGPFFVRTELAAGHAGPSGRWDALEEQALQYAFMLEVLGLDRFRL